MLKQGLVLQRNGKPTCITIVLYGGIHIIERDIGENIFSRGGWQSPPPRNNGLDEKQVSDQQRRFPN